MFQILRNSSLCATLLLLLVSCQPSSNKMPEAAIADSLKLQREHDSTLAWEMRPMTCRHTDLSNSFNVTTSISRTMTDPTPDFLRIDVSITDKKTDQAVVNMQYTDGFFLSDAFRDCNAVRSYTTGKNQEEDVIDMDYGDIVVADFNFDGQDDLAVKNDSGGNSGPTYDYYLRKDSTFRIDDYLSDSMSFFPDEFNARKKLLITLVPVGAYNVSRCTYRLNENTHSWTRTKHEILDARTDD